MSLKNKMKYSQPLILFFFILLGSNSLIAQEKDSTVKKQHFELSFGQSVLFISDKQLQNVFNETAITVPTSSLLFFAEFRPDKKLRIPVFFNLPTESKQYLIENEIVTLRSSPTFGSGVQFEYLKIKVDAKTQLSFEAGPLISLIFNQNNKIRVAPIAAGRIRITRGENFAMYMGASYSFGVDAFGLLYGTGTIF